MSRETTARHSGAFLPALCNVLGTLILLAVIVSYLPLALPQLLGYTCFNVISGSMEPTIPVGSVIYVEPVDAIDVRSGDVIAFYSDGSVVTHRVEENRFVEGKFITKGDANLREDFESTPYQALIGRVRYSIPYLGRFLTLYTSQVGKAYALCFAACGLLFNLLAGRLRAREREKLLLRLERELQAPPERGRTV